MRTSLRWTISKFRKIKFLKYIHFFRMELEVSSVQNCSLFPFKKKHHRTWAMTCIHEHNLNTFLLFLIQINQVLFIHFQRSLENQIIKNLQHDLSNGKFIAYKSFWDLKSANYAIFLRTIEPHNMVFMAMSQEKTIFVKSFLIN